MNKAREDTIREIADDLLGTCQTLAEVCEKHDISDDNLTGEDLLLFCETCGWWQPADIDDNGNCPDCRDDD